jgi:hypothetical protein
MGHIWTHNGVSGSYSTGSPLPPGDGRRRFSGIQPKRAFRRFSPHVALPKRGPSRPTLRSMLPSSPRTGMTGSNSMLAGGCGSWASPSRASGPTTSISTSGALPSSPRKGRPVPIAGDPGTRTGGSEGFMIHILTMGHLDPIAVGRRQAVVLRPLDMGIVKRIASIPGSSSQMSYRDWRRKLARRKFPSMNREITNGTVRNREVTRSNLLHSA